MAAEMVAEMTVAEETTVEGTTAVVAIWVAETFEH